MYLEFYTTYAHLTYYKIHEKRCYCRQAPRVTMAMSKKTVVASLHRFQIHGKARKRITDVAIRNKVSHQHLAPVRIWSKCLSRVMVKCTSRQHYRPNSSTVLQALDDSSAIRSNSGPPGLSGMPFSYAAAQLSGSKGASLTTPKFPCYCCLAVMTDIDGRRANRGAVATG